MNKPMKTFLTVLLCLISMVARGQKISALPEIFDIDTNDLFLIYTPVIGGKKATLGTVLSNVTTKITGIGGSSTNLASGNTIVLDATFGNDSTAQRTNVARPFLQASNAVAAIQTGDTLKVRGGTYLVNPKVSSGSADNSNGALAITNKSNFRITGEPGAIWQMSSRSTNFGASSSPMLILVNCTNVLIDNMHLIGFLTNGLAGQDFGIALVNCGYVTIDHCTLEKWNDQGITTLEQTCIAQNITIQDCILREIGTTNHYSLGADGTAISLNASNLAVLNCLFERNIRDFEMYGQPVARNIRYEGNVSYGVRDRNFFFVTTVPGISDVSILNNWFVGYATNAVSAGGRAAAIHIYSVSNIVIRGNYIAGYEVGINYGYGGTVANTVFVDGSITDNTLEDFTFFGIYMLRAVGVSATLERVSIMRNKFKNTLFSGAAVNGNNARVEDNELVDCALNGHSSGALMIGHVNAGAATNSTNITIIGNKIYNRAFAASAATGIVVTAGSISTTIWGNEVGLEYAGDLHNSGTGSRTMLLNNIAPSKILRSNGGSRIGEVTVGSGLTFDGTTLSASGGGGTPGGSAAAIQFAHAGVFAGTNLLVYDRTNNRVGIGTSTPVNNLDVGGGVAVGALYSGSSNAPVNGAIIQGNVGINTAFTVFKLNITDSGSPYQIFLRYSDSSAGMLLGGNSGGDFQISEPGGTARMVVGTGGNVGIGTLVPASSLDVTGQVRAASAIFTNGIQLVTIPGTGTLPAILADGTLMKTNVLNVTTVNASTLFITNGITIFGLGLTATNRSPGQPSAAGALVWSDGTNIIATLRDAGGAFTTNKLSMAAWP